MDININNKKKRISPKFILNGEILIPSKDVGLKSKRMAGYIASFYTYTIPKYAKGKLLDLGCGQAPMHEFYSKYVSNICCADWENSLHDQSFIDVFCDLSQKLIFDSNSFDTIILSDVINHLEEPELALKEIHRILKPGGILLLSTPFLYNLNEEPFDFGRYSIHKFNSWAKKFGFEIVYEKVFGGLADVFEHFTLRIISRFPLGNNFAKFLFYLRTFFIKNKLFRIKSVSDSPYGYGIVLKKIIE